MLDVQVLSVSVYCPFRDFRFFWLDNWYPGQGTEYGFNMKGFAAMTIIKRCDHTETFTKSLVLHGSTFT